MEEQLIQERHGKLLIIKFNNPKKKHALNSQIYQQLAHILNSTGTDDSISVVALTGNGGVGSFYTSGNDITQRISSDGDFEQYLQGVKQNFYNFVRAFIDFPKVLIAVVNGPCLGIGMTTAALCDVVYAADTAYFQTPFSKHGLCPEGCSSYTFPKIFGTSKATEILLLNSQITAEEALRYRFVSEIFHSNEELESVIWPKIIGYSNLCRGSLEAGKKLIRNCDRQALLKTLKEESDALFERWLSPEFLEAIQTFASRKSKM